MELDQANNRVFLSSAKREATRIVLRRGRTQKSLVSHTLATKMLGAKWPLISKAGLKKCNYNPRVHELKKFSEQKSSSRPRTPFTFFFICGYDKKAHLNLSYEEFREPKYETVAHLIFKVSGSESCCRNRALGWRTEGWNPLNSETPKFEILHLAISS